MENKNNGLPQGSVLAQTLFAVTYTLINSRRFIYADDFCIMQPSHNHVKRLKTGQPML